MNDHRQPAGQPTGGQFASHHRSEAEVSLDAPTGFAGALAAATADGKTFQLAYASYDDRLMDEQIAAYLAGDDGSLMESIDEAFSDQRWESALTEARELCEAAGIDYDDLDADEQEQLTEAIQERDDSDPGADLARNTPPQLMRAQLSNLYERVSRAENSDAVCNGNHPDSFAARTAVLSTLLAEHGVDVTSDANRQAIEGLVTEGPAFWHESVDLDVIFYDRIGDYSLIDNRGDDEAVKELDFTDGAYVVLLDRANGSGYDARLQGPIRARVTADNPVHLDSESDRGYGWDATAGVHKPAYAAHARTRYLELAGA